MAIDPQQLLALKIPDVAQRYAEKDAILYALGVGLGHDPLDGRQLRFVYEKDLQVLPTFAVVLAASPFLLRDPAAGIDFQKVVHGEQGLVLHRPLAPRGHVVGRQRIVDVVDKGAGKGALLYTERVLADADSGETIATLTQTIFCRGDGGFGGEPRATPAPHPLPDRAPDLVCDLATRPETALVYRLSGDLNPLHADPAFARGAGFERPILHGLATFGVCGHAILRALCGYEPMRLRAIAGRFSAPVFSGETIRTEIWRVGGSVSFRARVVGRDIVALNNGRAEVV
ncbi:MAG: MaoC family dehydratase N-terminal domain-containing protein [Pseudorhodoplanes sp.]|nr:MaoC family dehydratase N-terminal domain-containing protein [Pseudorhodoplanes sp.]